MKHFLIILLLIIGHMPIYGFTVDGYTYQIVSESQNKVKITSVSWLNVVSTIQIPQTVTYKGMTYNVTEINLFAFADANIDGTHVEKLIIPPTVERIYLVDSANSRPDTFERLKEIWCLGNTVPTINNYAGYKFHPEVIFVPQKQNYIDSRWKSYSEFIIETATYDTQGLSYSGRSQRIPYTSLLSEWGYEVKIAGNETEIAAGVHETQINATCYQDGKEFCQMSYPITYEIMRAPLSLKLHDCSREYGEPNPKFNYIINGFVNGESCKSLNIYPEISCSANSLSNVGNYEITGEFNSPNYETKTSNAILTITKAPLDISIQNAEIKYGDEIPEFNLLYTGLKNNEIEPSWEISPNVATTASKGSPVGVYPISMLSGEPLNYSVNNIHKGELVISKKNVTVKPKNVTRRYGEPNPEFKCDYFGFVMGENAEVLTSLPTFETSASEQSDCGDYVISASGVDADNYSFEYQSGTLTIIKAQQNISWSQSFDKFRVGDVVFLDGTCSSGLPVTYRTSNCNVAVIEEDNGLPYVKFVGSGTVDIIAEQNGNNNYEAAQSKTATAMVIQDAESITLSKSHLELYENDTYTLKADVMPVNTTNKSVLWESSDENIVTVENGTLTAINKGEAYISATTMDGTQLIAKCAVTVLKHVRKIVVEPEEIELEVGAKHALETYVLPSNASNVNLLYSSSDDRVATVDDGGIITALSDGEAIITIHSCDNSGVTAECHVSVLPKSGIEEVTMNTSLVSIYLLNGILLEKSVPIDYISNLSSGIYIICWPNGTSEKLIIK